MSPSSCTVTSKVPAVEEGALALRVTTLLPSGIVSFTAVMSKVAEAEPIGIVTEAGTVASVMSLEERVTTNSLVVAPVRVTVPTEAGFAALSEKLELVAVTVRVTDGVATANPLTPGEPMVADAVEWAKAPKVPATAAA